MPSAEPAHDASGGNERVSSNSTSGNGGTTPATVIPHVVGHHIDLALRMLADLGLAARVLTTEFHDKTDRHVVSTHPPAGTPAERTSVVEVVMGIAPTVADYVGHDADDAVRLAEVAGHVVEAVLADPGGTSRTTDVVVAQEPAPGERSRVLHLRVGPSDPPPRPL
jgi:beta-lactam-binding protein with PASTA domain